MPDGFTLLPVAENFRVRVITPALKAIDLWSPAAEALLLGTAIQESGLRDIPQRGGGPARGYFQIESATHEDIWDNFLVYRVELAKAVRQLCRPAAPSTAELIGNPRYECAIARIKYLRAPEPLPAADDLPAMAAYWKQHYNTAAGAGTPEQFLTNWRHFCVTGQSGLS